MRDHASRRRIAGADIILCSVMEDSCILDGSLVATTDAYGEFNLQLVPVGRYVIFYNPEGISPQELQELNNLVVEINDRSVACIGSSAASSTDCIGSIPFADDPDVTLVGITRFVFLADGTVILEGVYYTPKYGLYFGFQDGSPISVEIAQGENEIVIDAWLIDD